MAAPADCHVTIRWSGISRIDAAQLRGDSDHGDWQRPTSACWRLQPGASSGSSARAARLMHGLDPKRDRLVFGRRAALLDSAQRFAAEGHLRHRLKQLAVALFGMTLTKPFKQLAVELDFDR